MVSSLRTERAAVSGGAFQEIPLRSPGSPRDSVLPHAKNIQLKLNASQTGRYTSSPVSSAGDGKAGNRAYHAGSGKAG
jgi:hypothetical protein